MGLGSTDRIVNWLTDCNGCGFDPASWEWIIIILISIQILLLILESAVAFIQSYVISILSTLYSSEVN